jgi:hypothetical protein
MSRYAAETKVPAERSRAEIEKTLARYGCDGFMYGWEGETAVVAFRAHGKTVRFLLPMPDRQADEIAYTPTGQARSPGSIEQAYDQAIRQRWRALALAIKAKLEVVESGIVSFEDEFLAHFMLPDGQTVGQRLAGDLEQLTGSGLALLPPGS